MAYRPLKCCSRAYGQLWPCRSKDRVQLCLICLLHVREGLGCERRVMLEALTLLAPSRVGSCATSATSGALLPVLASSASPSLCLACTPGCSAEAWRLGRWGWSKLHPLEEAQSSFSLPVSKFPFLLQFWVPLGTRLTPPSLRPHSLVYVLSTSHSNYHHVPNVVTFPAFLCFGAA